MGNRDTRVGLAIAGGVGVTALIAFMMARKAKAAETPKPACKPRNSTAICINETCTGVVRGPNWRKGPAVFYIIENMNAIDDINEILGVPLPNNEAVNRSLDKLVREALENFTRKACWANAPWFDNYLRENPLPTVPSGGTRDGYYQALDNWTKAGKAWQAKQKQLAPALNALAKDLMTIGMAGFMIRFGIKPGYVGQVVDKTYAETLPSSARDRLMRLGYDIGQNLDGYNEQNTLLEFRFNFDAVMDYLSEVTWTAEGLNLGADRENAPFDESIDGAALDFALKTQKDSGVPWQAAVASSGTLPVVQKVTFEDVPTA